MKAEHRHQLQTNALADRMGRLVQSVKENPTSNKTIIGIVVGVMVIVAGIWYFTSGSAGWSALWVELDGKTDLASLDEIARTGQGTFPGRSARFQKARILLRDGLKNLYATERPKAITSLEEARKLYVALGPESVADPVLAQESLMGAAQAEEALVGVPKEDNPKETRGDLDRALQWYNQLAATYKDSFQGKAAAKHAQELEADKAKVIDFYTSLNKMADAKKIKP